MTTFITELFKLDLTHLNVKFSEENTFFESQLIKQQSLPFNVPYERSYLPFFDFVNAHNSSNANKYIKGLLFRNDTYYDAELMVLSVHTNIKAVIYYSNEGLSFLDVNLKSLPWPTITYNTIFEYANTVKLQNYPDTPVNFVPVYDNETYADYEWSPKTNYINKHDANLGFSELVNVNFFFNVRGLNVMRPFVYLRTILEGIFSYADYTLSGDIINDTIFNQTLLYHNTDIFFTNKDYNIESELNLTLQATNITGYEPTNVLYNEYVDRFFLAQYGTYNFTVNFEGELNLIQRGHFYFKVNFVDQNNVVGLTNHFIASEDSFENTAFSGSKTFTVNVDPQYAGNYVDIVVVCHQDIAPLISGNVTIKGTDRPLYNTAFNISDLLPDITVGEFLNDIKETYVLNSVLDTINQTASFNFFKNQINISTAVNLTAYQVPRPNRKFNRAIGYKVNTLNDTPLYINKQGEFIEQASEFKSVDVPFMPVPNKLLDNDVVLYNTDSYGLIFYSANPNASPTISNTAINLTSLGFIHNYQRQWLFQLLNSEDYSLTVTLPLYLASQITVNNTLWLYNNHFFVKKIVRYQKNKIFETLNLTLFKLVITPNFNLFIEDTLPPVVLLTDNATNTNMVTTFNTDLVPSVNGSAPSFVINVFANQSADPQGNTLTFNWQLISSPVTGATGIFNAQNTENSIVNFVSNGWAVAGVYLIRLTVTNTVGLSTSVDATVNVSNPNVLPPPTPVINIAKVDVNDVINDEAAFTISFTGSTPASANVVLQKYQTFTAIAVGAPIVSTITNFNVASHTVSLPSIGSWRVKVVNGNDVSNELAWSRLI